MTGDFVAKLGSKNKTRLNYESACYLVSIVVKIKFYISEIRFDTKVNLFVKVNNKP